MAGRLAEAWPVVDLFRAQRAGVRALTARQQVRLRDLAVMLPLRSIAGRRPARVSSTAGIDGRG